MAKLDPEQISQRLGSLGGWEYRDNAISKRYKFREFMDAIRFINRIAETAEAMDHHPDITINYNRILFSCSTHSEGGVTEKDLKLAGEIENAFKKPGQA